MPKAKKSSKKRTDYHAMLTMYGVDTMDARLQGQIVVWLRNLAREFEEYRGKEFRKVFAKNFRARFMK